MKHIKKNKFGFLVHARGIEDLYKKFPYLKLLPKKLVEIGMRYCPPIIASRITGLKDLQNNMLEGFIFAITMTAEQMFNDRQLTLKKIKEAVLFAEKKGVGIIGLGALTASFSKGGLSLVEENRKIGITTGRAYTVKTVTGYVKKCINDFNFSPSDVKLAIIGAGGSIGSNCSKILAKDGIKNFILIDVVKKTDSLLAIKTYLTNNFIGTKILISDQVELIRDADIIITASNAPEVLVESKHLNPGAIVINDAQPSDVSTDVIENRDDVLIIEGGVVSTPGIKSNLNMGLAHREETFCCLGEVLILAHNQHFDHFALGELDLELIDRLETFQSKVPMELAPYQNNLGYISLEQQNKVRNIILSKKTC